jgi:hypothetical protein
MTHKWYCAAPLPGTPARAPYVAVTDLYFSAGASYLGQSTFGERAPLTTVSQACANADAERSPAEKRLQNTAVAQQAIQARSDEWPLPPAVSLKAKARSRLAFRAIINYPVN